MLCKKGVVGVVELCVCGGGGGKGRRGGGGKGGSR